MALFSNDVLPFRKGKKIPFEAIPTGNVREFCGTESHPYQLHLSLNDIKHRRTRINTLRTIGSVERFNKTVLGKSLAETFRKKLYSPKTALEKYLDASLGFYNN